MRLGFSLTDKGNNESAVLKPEAFGDTCSVRRPVQNRLTPVNTNGMQRV